MKGPVDEPNLFGVSRKKKVAQAPTPSGAMSRLIGAYKAGYERRWNEPPVFTMRDGKTLKNLLQQFGEATVLERLTAYLAWDDKFAEDSGFSIATFRTSWPRLTALIKRKDKVPSVEDTSARLADYRRRRD